MVHLDGLDSAIFYLASGTTCRFPQETPPESTDFFPTAGSVIKSVDTTWATGLPFSCGFKTRATFFAHGHMLGFFFFRLLAGSSFL